MNVEEPEDNYRSGYIRLYRSVMNKAWYNRSEYVHLWFHLLLRANYKEVEVMFSGKPIKLKKGEFITSRKTLAKELSIDENKVERILKCFQTEQQIEQLTDHHKRIISIKSWELYQVREQQIEQQVNNNRTTTEQQVNTDKEYNKEINEKKEREKILLLKNSGNENIRNHNVRGYFIEHGFPYEDMKTETFQISWLRLLDWLASLPPIGYLDVQGQEAKLRMLNEYGKNESQWIEIINRTVEKKWRDIYPLDAKKINGKEQLVVKQRKAATDE